MKKVITLLTLFCGFTYTYAQVGVGTPLPNNSSQLDVVASNKGVLIPRIPLTSSTDATTITNGNVTSLLVFNTATAADVLPGYHYWDGAKWVRLAHIEDITTYQTTSTLVNNGDGTYTYTDENNTVTIIDVPADVINNATQIFSSTQVINEITNILENNSDTFVDNGDGTFTHTAVDGTAVTFDANTTSIIDNGDGTYTVTNDNGDTVTVDVVGDVVENIVNQGAIYNTIIDVLENNSDTFVDNGDGTFTHTAVDGTAVTFDANTTSIIDNGDGTYTVTNDNGDTVTVDVVGDVVENIVNQGAIYNTIIDVLENNSDTFVDNGDGTFTHTAVDGTAVTFDANTTSIIDNGDGTYTVTNDNGDTVTVDVVGDVVENIVNQGAVYNEIINVLENNSDTFVDNGDGTFTHTAVDGTAVTFDANTTSIIDNGDGTYTVTNDNGDTVTVDVVGDVVENIVNQGAIYNTIINVLENNSDTFVDNGDGTFTHTAVDGTAVTFDANTTSIIDNGDGTYTVTNDNGDTVTVDVVGDVVENIVNQGAIYNTIINVLENNSDTFVDNGDGTFTHTAVDGTAVTFDANTTSIIDNGDGTYTVTNDNGDTVTVDVVGDVVENIVNQGAVYNEIINVLENNSDTFVDNGDGTFTHTAVDGTAVTFDANTTSIIDNGDGTYTVTNDNGDTVTVDVVGDVVENIVNQGAVYNEIINVLENNSDTLIDNADGTFTHTAVDGTAVTVNMSATEPWFGTDDNMGATLNTEEIYSMGKVGIGTTTPFSVARLDVQETNNIIGINTLNKGANRVKGIQAFINSNMTANGALRNSAAHLESNPGIAAGVTNSSYDGAIYTGMLRGVNSLDAGTLANGYGIWAQYGHYNGGNASMVTNELYGLRLENYAQTGSIGNLYDLFIEDNVSAGIATNHWSIYNSSVADSYIKGNVGIGTTTPNAKLEVNGKVRVKDLTGADLATDVIVTADATTGELKEAGTITTLVQTGETTTTLAQNTTTGVITYTNEDTVGATANVVSTNANNLVTVGTDGGAYVNTNAIAEPWFNAATNTGATANTQNIYQLGNVGVGITPTSALHTSGPMAMPILSSAANITLDNTHAIVRIDATSGNKNITLPAANTCVGRIYTIIKSDASANQLVFSSTIQGNAYTFTNANVPGAYKIQSDGTNWVLINN